MSWSGINQHRQEYPEKKVLWASPNEVVVSVLWLSASFCLSFLVKPKFLVRKAGNVTDCCTHPNVINHSICTEREITLGWVCVLSLKFTQQSILPKQFCHRKILKIFTWGWKGIIQYVQEHHEKNMSVSNPKGSDSPNSLFPCLILFKLFKEIFIFNEQGLEWYALLHTGPVQDCFKP